MRFVALAVFAPVPAIAVGAFVAHGHGVAWQAFAPNAIAAVLGIAMTTSMLSERAARWAARWMPLVALAVIAATLASNGLDGVHRWLSISGLRLNASMAFAPWMLVPLATHESTTAALRAVALVVVVQLVHIAQPDGGQAMALAAGSVAVLLSRSRNARNACASLLIVALAVVAWMRPDPLVPVDHVERILQMIGENGVHVAIASVAGFCLVAPLLFTARAPLAVGCGVMLVAAFATTFFASVPVPLFGAGAGGVLCWYSMVAAVRGVLNRSVVQASDDR